MSQIPLVSFVVPCYNYGQYLPDCLASIFNQLGGADFEVLAIDDASLDNTPALLRSWSDSRLRIITHQNNLGHIATIQEGLGQARGEFIARIDPDDRYRPGFLSTVLEKFNAYPEVDLVYGQAAIINEHGSVTVEQSDTVHDGRDYKGNEFVALLSDNFICAPTVIARRQAWVNALPVPAGLAFNDWYFTLMMARRSEFYYLHQVLADYRIHPSNHHTRIAKDRTEEKSVFRLLDQIYSEFETDPALDSRKRRAKHHVYGAQYLRTADKYFGFNLFSEARRCYLEAILHNPLYLLRFDVGRRLVATFIGRKAYEFGKSALAAVSSSR